MTTPTVGFDTDRPEAPAVETSRRRFISRLVPGRLRGRRVVPDRWLARQQRRRQLRALGILLVIGAVAFVMWAVLFSSWLSVQQVQVVGLSPEGEVAGSAQVQNAAAITVGTPMARVDSGAAVDRIQQLPWVQDVEVRRGWPDTVVLAVTERTPVAVVETAVDGSALRDDSDQDSADVVRQGVDATGVVFDPPGGLWLTDPVIRGESVAIPEAVEVVATLPEEIARRVRVVQAVTPDDIRLRLGNDAIVRWGNASEPDFKGEVLAALLNRRAAGYDVSAPELPTTFKERGPKK